MESPYWGPAFEKNAIETILQKNKCTYQYRADKDLFEETAQALAEGKIVGWFQGRTEWGPRALGDRSILANPCRKDMKDILNLKIKKRESFRPFAPSIIEEKVGEYFEETHPVPFMEKVYTIRNEKQNIIPAVTHVDGTGRLQTVKKETNPRYYALIKAFEGKTGVPVLVNTSFNENEPIVNHPQEAIDCFMRTGMDMLVLENYIITK